MGIGGPPPRQGKTVTSQVLIFEIMPAPPAIASQLRIQINEQIYFSRRVRFVEGKPLMLEDSYMPVKLFRNLSLQHLEGSKFEYIEQECGILIGGNYESLTPVLADRLLARQMKVAEHTPLLRITSLSYSECNFAFFSGLIDAQFWAGSAQLKSSELTANYC